MLLIREYVDDRGRSPFAEWFQGLDTRAAAKVTVALARIETGNLSNAKGVGVLEYRIDWGPGYRVYYSRVGARLILLLGGGDKSSQDRDIREAKRHWQECQEDHAY